MAALAGYAAGFSLAKVSCYQQGLQRLEESQPWLHGAPEQIERLIKLIS